MSLGLLAITTVLIPAHCIVTTRNYLHRAGLHGAEAFVLWFGRRTNEHTFQVEDIYVPDQSALISEAGVCVTVSAEALHQLNVWLYRERKELIAQVHSHPTEAYHSDTDDSYPIVATKGAFSIVVPDFAKEPITLRSLAIYRLAPNSKWELVESNKVEDILRVIS